MGSTGNDFEVLIQDIAVFLRQQEALISKMGLLVMSLVVWTVIDRIYQLMFIYVSGRVAFYALEIFVVGPAIAFGGRCILLHQRCKKISNK